jgi:hypothetical protein
MYPSGKRDELAAMDRVPWQTDASDTASSGGTSDENPNCEVQRAGSIIEPGDAPSAPTCNRRFLAAFVSRPAGAGRPGSEKLADAQGDRDPTWSAPGEAGDA